MIHLKLSEIIRRSYLKIQSISKHVKPSV